MRFKFSQLFLDISSINIYDICEAQILIEWRGKKEDELSISLDEMNCQYQFEEVACL